MISQASRMKMILKMNHLKLAWIALLVWLISRTSLLKLIKLALKLISTLIQTYLIKILILSRHRMTSKKSLNPRISTPSNLKTTSRMSSTPPISRPRTSCKVSKTPKSKVKLRASRLKTISRTSHQRLTSRLRRHRTIFRSIYLRMKLRTSPASTALRTSFQSRISITSTQILTLRTILSILRHLIRQRPTISKIQTLNKILTVLRQRMTSAPTYHNKTSITLRRIMTLRKISLLPISRRSLSSKASRTTQLRSRQKASKTILILRMSLMRAILPAQRRKETSKTSSPRQTL